MGCSFSAEAPDRRPEQEEEEDALPVSLSAENREAIRSSWREIQEDISRVGVIMFVRLFETHPECKDAFFTFRDLNDVNTLRASKELKAHGLRIMYIIEKTVARIDQDDRLDQLILDLGRKHYHSWGKSSSTQSIQSCRSAGLQTWRRPGRLCSCTSLAP
ncbi:neuroglobin-like isoform X2 [Neolamprologus brichardi]|uniref:neuroglobin-like isoform X2 n=1 Tax=Neolamprologus brichardi TaxID=32507 RepID=UPI001643EC56|nr:neuroglobin-like isoform X2 [Neolamprologus brichardi]